MRRSFVFLTSSNFFSLMGVKPVVGRFYDAAECRPNANIPVVVASYPYWKKLGGRADLIGKPLTVNGQTYTLIGVTPDGFAGTNALLAPDLWLPLGVYSQLGSAFSDTSGKMDLTAPKNYTLNLVARMRSGLTIESTKPRLPTLAKRLTAVQPPDSTGTRELQIQTPSRFSISTTPSDDGPIGLIGTLLSRWRRRFCSSPASTWPTCCWRGGRIVPGKSPCGWRSERAAGESLGNCCAKECSSPSSAARLGCSSVSGATIFFSVR